MEHAKLAALADDQGGLFTWRQARDAGYSSWQIRARLQDRRWRRVLGNVLGGAGVPDSPSTRDRAAYLAGGTGAVLSGPSAARLHGMEIRAQFSCVTVPRRRHLAIDGVRILREPVVDDDLILLSDMLVTSTARTVFDCLRVLPQPEASALLDRALQRKWLTLADASHGARSEAERQLHRGLRDAGITGWVANQEVHDATGLIGVVDIAFPKAKLAIEVDGRAWHSAMDRFQRDRTRQNRLVNAGWAVLRFTWHDLTTDLPAVITAIRTALAGHSSDLG